MSSTTGTTGTRATGTTSTHPVRSAARAVGIVFLVVGVLGFVPGVTSHFGDMTFAGHMSDAKLLGLFQVSILHNLVHLLFGVLGLALSRRASQAKLYLIVGGVVYLVLWVYGLAIGMDSSANFVPVNNADNWLHLVLGVGMILLGVILGRGVSADADSHTA
jgi:arginine exporter protein ArgO